MTIRQVTIQSDERSMEHSGLCLDRSIEIFNYFAINVSHNELVIEQRINTALK